MKNTEVKKNHYLFAASLAFARMPASLFAIDNPGITSSTALPGHVPIIENAGGIASPLPLFIDANAAKGISTATDNLSDDFRKACGTKASVTTVDLSRNTQFGKRIIVVGSIGDKLLEPLFNEGKLDRKMLKGKKEKYILKTVANP